MIAGQKGRTLSPGDSDVGKGKCPKGLYAQPQIERRAPMERTSITLDGVSSAILQGARFFWGPLCTVSLKLRKRMESGWQRGAKQ
jgi:hypothetical protein